MDKPEYAVDKYPLNPDKAALAAINSDKSVWQEMFQNWRELPTRTKTALVIGTIGVLGTLGVVGESDRQAEELTNQSNEHILDQAEQVGLVSGQNFVETKPDEIDTGLGITPQDVPENAAIPGNDGLSTVDNVKGDEQPVPESENSAEREGRAGPTEPEVPKVPANPVVGGTVEPEVEGQIGDAFAAVRGENGEINVDPVTGEPVPNPEAPQG